LLDSLRQEKPLVGLLLAAGSSSRFGSDKLQARVPGDVHGRTVLQCTAAALTGALPPNETIFFVAYRAIDTLSTSDLTSFKTVVSPASERGMGATLAALMQAALHEVPHAAGAIVMLADLPFIQASSITAVAHALRTGVDIAAPSFRGKRGHPVGFSARHFAALAALDGDEGAKPLLSAHAVTLLPVDDAGVLHDVDTPEALRQFSAS
jgi:molybdenum cofactor cytidylyltransferase